MAYPLVSLESIPPLEPYLSDRRSRSSDYAAQVTFAAILFERETYYTAIYHTYGPYGPEPPADHDWAWHPYPATSEGRQALAERRQVDLAASARALDLFGLKADALGGLQAVLRPKKSALNGYLVALHPPHAETRATSASRAGEAAPRRHSTMGRDVQPDVAATGGGSVLLAPRSAGGNVVGRRTLKVRLYGPASTS